MHELLRLQVVQILCPSLDRKMGTLFLLSLSLKAHLVNDLYVLLCLVVQQLLVVVEELFLQDIGFRRVFRCYTRTVYHLLHCNWLLFS